VSLEKKIRILHVVGGSLNGGAAKGAINLHNALIEKGASSFIINNYENGNIDNLIRIGSSKLKAWLFNHIDKIPIYFYLRRKKIIFSPGIVGENIIPIVEKLNIDVLHLHWINTGFINIAHLNQIGIPIIWTMRDAWPFTGGCHMPMNCIKFTNHCNKCEQLASKYEHDISYFIQKRKKEIISKNPNITFVAISPFLQSEAKKSYILKDYKIEMIENNVDINQFKLSTKASARDKLEIMQDKCIILIANDSGETWKGYEFLYKLVDDISIKNVEFISFGSGKPCHKGKNFGFVNDTDDLALIYSAADVFIFPSTYEPFGKALFEAAACGNSIVSFENTGSADFYDNEVWWHLAEYGNYQSLLDKTLIACNQKKKVSSIDQRKAILSKFGQEKIALKYLELYKKNLDRNND